MKRIIICSDGTWNRPEELGKKSEPTNVLRLAREVAPIDQHGNKQVVFYDWGIGSYHNSALAGGFGVGLEKNVMDGYRFLVHNYEPGDEIFLFGFSRGAYTIRSLAGFINNCGILKSLNGSQIEEAFKIYKTKAHKPKSDKSVAFRRDFAVEPNTRIKFIGAWDTVGAMGLPYTIFSMINDSDLFFDRKLGSNIDVVRHALALDEFRADFEPTIWLPRPNVDMKQVWFCGCHSDIGGSYLADKNNEMLSNISHRWMLEQAIEQGLKVNIDVSTINASPFSKIHNEYKGKFRLLGKLVREIPTDNETATKLHQSVIDRLEQNPNYKSPTLEAFKQRYGRLPEVE